MWQRLRYAGCLGSAPIPSTHRPPLRQPHEAAMIRPERLTIKAQEAFRDAGELARRRGNPVVNDAHLLAALLAQPEGVVQPLLQKAGLNVTALGQASSASSSGFPRQEGGARADLQPRAAARVRPRRRRRGQDWATRTSRPSTCCWRMAEEKGTAARGLLSAQNVCGRRPPRGARRRCAARTGSPTSRPRRSTRRWSATPAT